MEENKEPLLSPSEEAEEENPNTHLETLLATPSTHSFTADADDIHPINTVRDFFKEFRRRIGARKLYLGWLRSPSRGKNRDLQKKK